MWSGDGEGNGGSNNEVNEDVDGDDGESKVDCHNYMDGDSGDKNNGGVDDGAVYINDGDDANCSDDRE